MQESENIDANEGRNPNKGGMRGGHCIFYKYKYRISTVRIYHRIRKMVNPNPSKRS